jgi:hypothetical protein
VPEFGGGWFDPWGGAWFDGKGYAESRRQRDAAYERRFYLTNLANGITLHSVYMTFGGTSWGWLPAPVVYTSYDYGAAIDEGRQPTDKLIPMHQLGQLLRHVPDFAKLDRAADVQVDGLKVYHLTNPDTHSHVYVLRNDGTEPVDATLPLPGTGLPVTVPAREHGCWPPESRWAGGSCATPTPSPCWPSPPVGRRSPCSPDGRARRR